MAYEGEMGGENEKPLMKEKKDQGFKFNFKCNNIKI